MTEVPLYRILNPATPPSPHLAAHTPSYLTALLARSSGNNNSNSPTTNNLQTNLSADTVLKEQSSASRNQLQQLESLLHHNHPYTPFHSFLDGPLTPSATPLAHRLPRFHPIPQYSIGSSSRAQIKEKDTETMNIESKPSINQQKQQTESKPPLPPKTASTVPTSNDNGSRHLLSTSSPEGIHVASQITPTRLANLLIRKGPLPIRHITSQLALEVTNFTNLSLSKQRRLIMAAMDQVDPENNVVFEKIGWGQWAVRKVDSDFIVTEGTESAGAGTGETHINNGTSMSEGNGNGESRPPLNVHDLRNQTNLKLGWSKKQNNNSNDSNGTTRKALTGRRMSAEKFRRESITSKSKLKNLHNVRPPTDFKEDMAIASDLEDEDDNALAEFDEDEEVDDDDEDDEEDLAISSHAVSSESELSSGLDVELPPNLLRNATSNAVVDEDAIVDEDEKPVLLSIDSRSTIQEPFHVRANSTNSITSRRYSNSNSKRMSPPIRFAKRVPMKTSPPPQQHGSFSSASRRRSSSSNNQIGKIASTPRHQIFSRSRLNSFDNLDNYILSSAKSSQILVNSPPPPPNVSVSSYSATSSNAPQVGTQTFVISPPQDGYLPSRRKSSFNESHLRLTITSSPNPASPKLLTGGGRNNEDMQVDDVDTEDEDWERIGAEKLRQQEALNAEKRRNDAGHLQKNSNINTISSPTAEPVGSSPNHSHTSGSPSKDQARLTFHATAEDERAAFALVDMMSV